MKKTISMVMMVLAAACVAFGKTYEKGKVYGPISILGEEAVTVDGHGAIIDGGGTARCATLGPNVTLKNFTFRNGKAAVGGGVWGGAVSNCTITGCTATEYGAAVVKCKAHATAITGCTLPLSSSKVAIHGGIAADSTLDGVTISGCRVELGTTAATVELYSTNYTALDVILLLPQNLQYRPLLKFLLRVLRQVFHLFSRHKEYHDLN